MKCFRLLMWILGLIACGAAASDKASLGPRVFFERCVLCHGKLAMGEGILPLKLVDYPQTNLLAKEKMDRDYIRSIIVHGGEKEGVSDLMPPMGEELSNEELEAVTDFVVFIREDTKSGSSILKELAAKEPPTKRTGEHLFSTRCALCHGKTGEGDGRMAKVIKTPPPANLVKSGVNAEYIKKIIVEGGEAMGRSRQMPPWGDQFSAGEIESIILYVMALRRNGY